MQNARRPEATHAPLLYEAPLAQVILHNVHPSEDLIPYVRHCVHEAGLEGATLEITRHHTWSKTQRFIVAAKIDDGPVELRADVDDGDLYLAIARAFDLLRRRRHFHRFGTQLSA